MMAVPELEKQAAADLGVDVPVIPTRSTGAALKSQEKERYETLDDTTQAETSTERTAKPPPDGGLLAWLQVLGSFFLFMNTW